MESIITIDGKEVKVITSNRVALRFEKEAGKPYFKMEESMTDIVNLFYACIKVANRGVEWVEELDRESFIDLLDRDNNAIEAFSHFMIKANSEKLQQVKPNRAQRRKASRKKGKGK